MSALSVTNLLLRRNEYVCIIWVNVRGRKLCLLCVCVTRLVLEEMKQVYTVCD
jgi:hypothetical protein